MNTQHVKSYPMLAFTALAAALTLTACGPQDGIATTAVAAAPAPVSNAVPVQAAPAPTGAPVYVQTQAQAQAPVQIAQAAPVLQPVQAAPAMQPVPTTRPVAQQTYTAPQPAPVRVASATLGQVRAIEPIRTRPQGSGAGAVVGGVLGAVLGNQIGSGNGRAAATALGAVGGAVAGNNVERNHKEGISGYRVRVQLDNGSERTYEETHVGGLRVGDRVRVERGQVRRV